MADKRVLAIDLGASSGRGIVFEFSDGRLVGQSVVHRFPNGVVERDGKCFWDLNMLFEQTLKAIELACKTGKLDSVGIDSWGVDFGFVDKDGNVLVHDFRHYRDPANAQARLSLDGKTRRAMFDRSGISDNDFNTTYQLIARAKEGFDFSRVKYMLFTPQLLGYMLTGVAVTEPTIASTSGLYTKSEGFDVDFLKKLNVPASILPEVVPTGSVIGDIKRDIKQKLGIDYPLPVVASAGHDTACAVRAISDKEKYPLFLSSGTWSLFGALIDTPIINDTAWQCGYTNELACGGKVRLLRNIMGMWIIQECRRQWQNQGLQLDYPQIVDLAKDSADKGVYIDVNDSLFAQPCNMADNVKAYVKRTQGISLDSVGDVAKCVYYSLAKAYKSAYDGLTALTGSTYDRLHIVGGGANNAYLNQLIAKTLNIEVVVGATEASALGNALSQN